MVKKKEVKKTKKPVKPSAKKKTKKQKELFEKYWFWAIVSSVVGFFVAAVIFGTAGIVLGSLSLKKKENKNRAILGIVLGSVDVLLWVVSLFVLYL